MDFTNAGATKLVVYGRSPIDKNTIHVWFVNHEGERNQLVEFTLSDSYEEQIFELEKVTFFIGKSNRAGRARLEIKDLEPIDRASLFNGLNQWERKLNGLSIASEFTRLTSKSYPHSSLGVISNSRGGTRIEEWQMEAGTELYEEAVRRTKEAMKSGTLRGILWHQSESDQSLPVDLPTTIEISELVQRRSQMQKPSERKTLRP
ncbi:sialate O-acetylesterase [Paenibacillus puerhi]|uniref:sialate O-acetylesterase n=1 Tax=Paenibacillus puerhi TaxID=2692622 RepID=UPI00135C4EF6|nr:sialate O-acetylesterase [Paenibacillus puerhi]